MSEDKAFEEAEPLLWKTQGPVAIITLNRPQAMNSFDMDLMSEHRRRLEEFEAHDDLRVEALLQNFGAADVIAVGM